MQDKTAEIEQIIERQALEIKELKEQIVILLVEIKELKARLNSNSNNSSKPPSSDGYQKKPAFPKTGNGKKGGQTGHIGNTLKQISNPDETIVQPLCTCTKCGENLGSVKSELSEKRQVFELPQPRLLVIEYQTLKGICPNCGDKQYSNFPDGVNAPVQYGNGVKALTTLLNVVYKIPFKKVRFLFGDLFHYQLNESTVITNNESCYVKLEMAENNIREQILESIVVHFDESGVRVGGRLNWLHTATTVLFTYLWVHINRGRKALDSPKSIIGDFNGWAMHDCWSSYFGYSNVKHAVCGAHILRELEALIEEKSLWAGEFKFFLLEIYHFRKRHPYESKTKWKTEFDRICERADIEEPPARISGNRGRKKRTKGRNLLERLIKHKEAGLAFAYNVEVPFTNNQAERDIRPVKVKQKVSGCFRTFHGAEVYARIEGYVSTLRKNRFDIFKELTNDFNSTNVDFNLST